MVRAFAYIIGNHGIDGEDEYGYTASDGAPCWTNAEKRVLATMDNFTSVPVNSEAQLAAAVALGPVAVAIEADQPAFQNYKSGVFNPTPACGTKLDHGIYRIMSHLGSELSWVGVLVVGFTADAWIVKNRYSE